MANYAISLCALLLFVGAPVISSTTVTFDNIISDLVAKAEALVNSTTIEIQDVTDIAVEFLTENLEEVSAVSDKLISAREDISDATCLANLDTLVAAINTSIANATAESDDIVAMSQSYIDDFGYLAGSITNYAANLSSDLDSCDTDTSDIFTVLYCILESKTLTETFTSMVRDASSLAANATALITSWKTVKEETIKKVTESVDGTFSEKYFDVMVACNWSSTFLD